MTSASRSSRTDTDTGFEPPCSPTHYFRLENDKSTTPILPYSVGNVDQNAPQPHQTPSPANDHDPQDHEPDVLPDFADDLIAPHLLSRTSFTTAATTSSVPQGVKPPSGGKPPRRYPPCEVLEMNRGRRDNIVTLLETSRAVAMNEGRAVDPLLPEWVERMQECGKGAYFMPHPHTGREVITNFRGCKVRICPICAWRASIRKALKYGSRIQQFIEAHPSYRLRFVTLTDRPVPMMQLSAQCGRLQKAFSRFYASFDRAFVGYFRCTDIATVNRDPNGFHPTFDTWREAPMLVRPHIHAIVIQRPKNGTTYVADAEIKQVWAQAMVSEILLDTHAKDLNTPIGAAKYACKGVDWSEVSGDADYTAALALALHGVRCAAAGGVLRGAA